jgi:phosphoglycerate dehydrogenase-like enzyme
MMEICVCCDVTGRQLERVARAADGFTLMRAAPDQPCNAAIVFGNPAPEIVGRNSRLRWLQLESVGFGEYARLDWTRTGAVVTNLAGFFAEPVAETALAGILALYRGVDRLTRLKAEQRWLGDPLRRELRLLRGAHVVLYGYGAINRRLEELLVPFGCSVTPFGKRHAVERLDAALPAADIVVCAAPATPATNGFFDAARFARLQAGAVFCNLGRGSLVDEEALAAALEANRLAGAVIDVTKDEPLPAGHRFWTCPNLILSQHSGGGTRDEMDRKVDVFLANLVRFRSGAPLADIVDFSRGY